MDPLAVQRTRYLLRSRFRLAMKCPRPLLGPACLHLLEWLTSHALFGPIVARLRRPQHDALYAGYAEKVRTNQGEKVPRIETLSMDEHAAVCLSAVRAIAEQQFKGQKTRDTFMHWVFETLVGEELKRDQTDEAYDAFREVALDGLYDFLDEQLDARNVLYSLLLKYQRRAEWFRRAQLRDIAKKGLEGHLAGERSLSVDLQLYVFDQGVDFTIEPSSASGEPDLILRDSDDRHVVIDAKYVQDGAVPSKILKTVAGGLHQVARYCEDFQEPAGFLVIFYDHKKKPRLPLETRDGLSYFLVRSVLIYVVMINIYDSPSASLLGTAEEIVFEREQLLSEIPAGDGSASP